MRQFVVVLLVCIFIIPTVTAVMAEDIKTEAPAPMGSRAVTIPPPVVQGAIKKIASEVSKEYLFAYESKLQGFGSRFYNAQGNVNCVKWLNESGTGMGRINVSYHNWTVYSTMLGRLVTATNVVYTLPGLNTSSDRIYYMYNHMDSIQFDDYNQVRDKAPGADDDGSGVASALETARVLSRYDFQDTIKFVFFNGEEIGLYGASYYAQNISNVWHENVQGGIDYDMIGYSDGTMPYDLELYYNPASAWEYDYLIDANQRYDVGLRLHAHPTSGSIPSDINAFYAIGKPSVMGIEYQFSPYYHQFTDTVDKLNMTLMEKSTKLAVVALSEMSRLLYVDAAIDQNNISVSNDKPTEDEIVTVTANITNTGNINATNMAVTFFADGFPIKTNRIWVPAGGQNTTSADWKATIGNHVLSVELDPDNEIVETDETNNTAYVTVAINDRPRAILLAQPLTILTNESVIFDGSQSSDLVGGVSGYNFTFGDGSDSGWVTNSTRSHLYTTDGLYIASLTVRDPTGAESYKSNISIKVLNRAPFANPSSNQTRTLTNVPIKFMSNATDLDGTVTVHWTLGDGCQTAETDPVHSYSKAGTYDITLDIEDNDLASASYSLRVTIDNRAPTVKIDAAAISGDITTDFTLTSNATDADGTIVSNDWDLGDGTTSSGAQAIHRFTKPGNYTVRLTVRDDDNAQAWALIYINIMDTPPSAFGTAMASETITFKKVVFRGDESTDLEGPLTYLWDFGDGNYSTDANPQHAYWIPGTYDVTVTVKDTAGQTDTAVLDPVKVFNRPPKAEFRHFGNYTLNNTVYFDATNSSDPEGPLTYHWSFSDGTEATGPVVGHVFPSAGPYSVNLTVTDLSGESAKATKTLTINAPPPPPAPPKKEKPKDNSGTVNLLTMLVVILIILIVVLAIAFALSRKRKKEPQFMPPGPPPPLTIGPSNANAPTTEAPPAPAEGPNYPDTPQDRLDEPPAPSAEVSPPSGPLQNP